MLKDAMWELALGDPARLSTDVGPLIDAQARQGLLTHIDRMRAAGHDIFQLPLPENCNAGTFFPPTLIEIDNIAELEREVFGPILHVVRFRHGQLDALVSVSTRPATDSHSVSIAGSMKPSILSPRIRTQEIST